MDEEEAPAPQFLDDMPLGFSRSLFKLISSDSGFGPSTPLDPNTNSDTVDVVVHRDPRFEDQMAVTFSNDASRYQAAAAANEEMAHLSDVGFVVSDVDHSDSESSNLTYGYLY